MNNIIKELIFKNKPVNDNISEWNVTSEAVTNFHCSERFVVRTIYVRVLRQNGDAPALAPCGTTDPLPQTRAYSTPLRSPLSGPHIHPTECSQRLR